MPEYYAPASIFIWTKFSITIYKLFALFLVSVLTKSFFSFVITDLVSFPLFSAGH